MDIISIIVYFWLTIKMSDISRYEVFLAVVEHNGVTEAANYLHLSKAAVSKQIRLLEAEAQVDLFHRKNRKLILNDAGRAVLDQCLKLQDALVDTRSMLKQFQAAPSGRLHVAASTYFAQEILFPNLAQFRKIVPDLQIYIDTREGLPSFDDARIDLAFGFSMPAPDTVYRKKLGRTRYILCATPQYFEKQGMPKKLNDLLSHVYIGHASRPVENTLNLNPKYTLNIKPALLLNNSYVMLDAMLKHVGIGQQHGYIVKKYLASGQLLEIFAHAQASDVPVYAYYKKHRYIQPKVRVFLDFFSRMCVDL